MPDVNALIPIYMELRSAFLPSELKLIQRQRGADSIWVWVTNASPAERRAAIERIPSAKQLRAQKVGTGRYVVEMPDGAEVHITRADQFYEHTSDGWDISFYVPGFEHESMNDWIATKTAALFLAREAWLLEGGHVARHRREREQRFERFGF